MDQNVNSINFWEGAYAHEVRVASLPSTNASSSNENDATQ